MTFSGEARGVLDVGISFFISLRFVRMRMLQLNSIGGGGMRGLRLGVGRWEGVDVVGGWERGRLGGLIGEGRGESGKGRERWMDGG